MARSREFDIDQAVDKALHLFWTKGYEGTTLGDLTDAMRINRPSLYAAFGNKEALFRRAVERYVSDNGKRIRAALDEPSARDAIFKLLRFYSDAANMPERPAGCLLVQGALVCSEESEPVRAVLAERRRATEHAIGARLERAKQEGELPPGTKPKELARYIYTVCMGMSVQAASGATSEQLRRIADQAMLAWPVGVVSRS